ncbi:hypothetical protein [Edwardsiella phage PVN06]|nr:hypothetical protein [Edwardsiella phage PVN06]
MNVRKEFEKWYQVQDGAPDVKELRDIFKLDEYGEYYFLGTRLGWRAWQAAWQASQPKWIKCSEQMPEEFGRYWCYVEEQNSLGKSNYQWNCSWNGDVWSDKALTGRVTHWMPLPNPPEGDE